MPTELLYKFCPNNVVQEVPPVLKYVVIVKWKPKNKIYMGKYMGKYIWEIYMGIWELEFYFVMTLITANRIRCTVIYFL